MSKAVSYKNILYITTCLSSIYLANMANALPESPEVQSGNVSFNQNNNELHIQQHTEKTVINWKGFDINNGELTQFHQPSSSAIALNRVISQNPTKIDGALRANGNIIIINQNGVLFGRGANVDVNGLIASTIDIDNDKFINAKSKFEFNKPGNIDAKIINEGKISAKEAGLIGLVAPQVINDGVIIANGGTITLASGETFTIDMYGDKIIEVAVSDTLKKQLIENNNLIQADGGKIVLTAAAGKEIVDSLISVNGALKATSVKEVNGEIIIFAEGSTTVKGNIATNKGIKKGTSKVEIAGTIDASGINPGEKGGKILVAGDDITLKKNSLIVASGYDGKAGTTEGAEESAYREGSAGGHILIGGDYLGKGSTPTARNLTMENYAVIVNDSLNTGDAGRTILWSDNETKFNGFILSRSFGGKKAKLNSLDPETGGNAGDAGFVETSGHKHLDSTGFAILTASNGERGTHLLDPENITIYGNFSPTYQSTDSSINLASKLKIHYDASSKSSVTLSYLNSSLTGAGTSGGTLTVADPSSLSVGMQIRLSNTSLTGAADVFNSDTYTITNISGTTVTTSPVLNTNYTSAPIYVGYVSSWADSAGTAENAATSDTTKMPLWLVDIQNGNPIIKFDGTSDSLNADLSFMNDASYGWNGIPHTNFYTAKTTTYGRLYTTATSGGDSYEGFKFNGDTGLNEYTMDYLNGDDRLSRFVTSGSINPSSAYSTSSFNTVTYQWLPDSGPDNLNTRRVYANTKLEVYSNPHAGTIGPYNAPSTIGGKDGYYWGGQMAEIMMYNANLDTNTINLLSQYASAKWDQALVPPGSSAIGVIEAYKAMASTARGDSADGYSKFTTDYLERLSQSASINLRASSDITLDLKGDTLTLNNGAVFTLSAGGNISSFSSGTIKTKKAELPGGHIDINAGGNLDLSNISMNAQDGGTIILVAGAGRSLSFNPNTFSNNPAIMRIGSPLPIPHLNFPVSISGITASNKIYDATTSGTFSGTIAASNASVTGTPVGIFADKNVGTGKSVTLSGVSLTLTGDYNYYYTAPTYTANITKANLSVSGLSFAASKVYDATTAATVNGTASVTPIVGDSVSVIGTPVGNFVNKNSAVAPKGVSVTGLSLTGTDASNYQITYPAFSQSITKRSLTVSGLSAANKVYDGTISATINGTASVTPIVGDSVSVIGTPVGNFVNKNVGIAKPITASGLSLTGADADNYTIAGLGLSANITKASLNVTANNVNVVYPASTADLTYRYTGLKGSDTSANFIGNLTRNAGISVGSYRINRGDLTALENYEIEDFTSGIFNISAPSSAELVNTIPSSSSLFSSFTSSMNNSSISGNALSILSPLGSMSSSDGKTTAVKTLMPSSNAAPASTQSLIDMNDLTSVRTTTVEPA